MKITLARLSTKNLATFAERVIHSSKQGNYTATENFPLLISLESAYQKYDEVYNKQTYSGKGNSVADADQTRDKAFTVIKNFLWGYRQVTTAPNADKAEELYAIFKQVGLGIDRLSYAEQSAQMKKLIEELNTESNQAKLTVLSLSTAFQELKDTQEAFETLFGEQAEANAELRKSPSASAMRRELEQTLRAYLSYLTAMKNVPEWEGIYRDINELVKAARNG